MHGHYIIPALMTRVTREKRSRREMGVQFDHKLWRSSNMHQIQRPSKCWEWVQKADCPDGRVVVLTEATIILLESVTTSWSGRHFLWSSQLTGNGQNLRIK